MTDSDEMVRVILKAKMGFLAVQANDKVRDDARLAVDAILASDWLTARDAQVRAEVIDWIDHHYGQVKGSHAAAREHFAPKPEGNNNA